MRSRWLSFALLLAACGNRPSGFTLPEASMEDASMEVPDSEPPPDEFFSRDIAPIPVESGVSRRDVYVYAHTADTLYLVEPRTFAFTRIGDFQFPNDLNNHEMTDLAITRDGQLWGVTRDGLYRVEPTNAQCSFVADLSAAGSILFNGLSFVATPGGVNPERLIAATRAGAVYEINTSSGIARQIGRFDDMGLMSAGDLVSVEGAGTFATVVRGTREYLARIDESTGAATIVGPTGLDETWGLGYWGGRLYGFTATGIVASIDVMTGLGTVVSRRGPAWWGAGVTTTAPIVPPL